MREVRIEYKPDIAIITVEDGPNMRTVRLTKEEMLEMANETLQKYSNHWTAKRYDGFKGAVDYKDPDLLDKKLVNEMWDKVAPKKNGGGVVPKFWFSVTPGEDPHERAEVIRQHLKEMDQELNKMVGDALVDKFGGKYQVVDKNGVVVQGKIGIKLKTAKMYCDKLNQFGDNKPYSIVEK